MIRIGIVIAFALWTIGVYFAGAEFGGDDCRADQAEAEDKARAADVKDYKKDVGKQKAAETRSEKRKGRVDTAVTKITKEAENDPAPERCTVTVERQRRLRDAFERIDRAAAEAGPGSS